MSILNPSTTPTTRQVWPALPKPGEGPVTATCITEDDGHHVHEYRTTVPVAGRMTTVRIEHHMHAWMDEHKRLYPHVKDVGANTLRYTPLGYWDTVEQAWKALGVAGDIPSVACRA
jgi:hypothetical protein